MPKEPSHLGSTRASRICFYWQLPVDDLPEPPKSHPLQDGKLVVLADTSSHGQSEEHMTTHEWKNNIRK